MIAGFDEMPQLAIQFCCRNAYIGEANRSAAAFDLVSDLADLCDKRRRVPGRI